MNLFVRKQKITFYCKKEKKKEIVVHAWTPLCGSYLTDHLFIEFIHLFHDYEEITTELVTSKLKIKFLIIGANDVYPKQTKLLVHKVRESVICVLISMNVVPRVLAVIHTTVLQSIACHRLSFCFISIWIMFSLLAFDASCLFFCQSQCHCELMKQKHSFKFHLPIP